MVKQRNYGYEVRNKKSKKRQHIKLSEKDIERVWNLPQREAARRLGICVSTLKRQFYHLKPNTRWPYVPYQLQRERREREEARYRKYIEKERGYDNMKDDSDDTAQTVNISETGSISSTAEINKHGKEVTVGEMVRYREKMRRYYNDTSSSDEGYREKQQHKKKLKKKSKKKKKKHARMVVQPQSQQQQQQQQQQQLNQHQLPYQHHHQQLQQPNPTQQHHHQQPNPNHQHHHQQPSSTQQHHQQPMAEAASYNGFVEKPNSNQDANSIEVKPKSSSLKAQLPNFPEPVSLQQVHNQLPNPLFTGRLLDVTLVSVVTDKEKSIESVQVFFELESIKKWKALKKELDENGAARYHASKKFILKSESTRLFTRVRGYKKKKLLMSKAVRLMEFSLPIQIENLHLNTDIFTKGMIIECKKGGNEVHLLFKLSDPENEN
mmetsp:Transcript_11649/g.17262  ORF Transcript_11649/g.17262 Transcript_11649/m.17262 type:complete len:435 (-) Transcript_11649:3033-4337(-)